MESDAAGFGEVDEAVISGVFELGEGFWGEEVEGWDALVVGVEVLFAEVEFGCCDKFWHERRMVVGLGGSDNCHV